MKLLTAGPNPLVRMLRRVVGLICLTIGILGLILPILPGWPFIIPAIVLLGRRDPMLRRLHLLVRWVLRFLRRHPVGPLRGLGVRLSGEYVRFRRAIVPKIISAERTLRIS